MKINTLMWRAAALAAGALLAVAAFSGPPEGVPIKFSYWGSGIETAVDSNQDGLLLSLSMTEAQGSFGASSAYITSEFRLATEQEALQIGCEDGFTPLILFQSTAIVSFANGDQLFGMVLDEIGGEMCLSFVTGYYYGDADGVYIGGTGRFAGASGTFHSEYTGYNLEPMLTGFRSIQGTIEGTVVMP
jgi:hypothetical protein